MSGDAGASVASSRRHHERSTFRIISLLNAVPVPPYAPLPIRSIRKIATLA
jgi:hypothetical protein